MEFKDKGLLVITGCGQAGVVNICRYARRLANDQPLCAVMGWEVRPLVRSGSVRLRPSEADRASGRRQYRIA